MGRSDSPRAGSRHWATPWLATARGAATRGAGGRGERSEPPARERSRMGRGPGAAAAAGLMSAVAGATPHPEASRLGAKRDPLSGVIRAACRTPHTLARYPETQPLSPASSPSSPPRSAPMSLTHYRAFSGAASAIRCATSSIPPVLRATPRPRDCRGRRRRVPAVKDVACCGAVSPTQRLPPPTQGR